MNSYVFNGDKMTIKHILKKVFTLIFILLFLFNFYYVFADDIDDTSEVVNTLNEIEMNNTTESSSTDTSTLNLNARSCIVLDRLSKKTLYGKNEQSKVKMASTTKIMTATIILENCNLNETIEVSKKAAGTGGSRLGLKTGDKITIRDLLYGLLLCSGNDAAVALAETAGGSIQGFSEMMNAKAKELGLHNTHFESPHGLDSDQHYTTAYELALLSDYALKNESFLKIVGTKNYTVTINGYSKTLSNTNELLGNLNGVYGIKTGFTNGANRCLVTACKRDNMDIICVVLGCDTKKFRTTDSIKLIEYAFKNFEYINISEQIEQYFSDWKNQNPDYFTVTKGITSNVKLKYSEIETPILPILRSEIPYIKIDININRNLQAPLVENTILGGIDITTNNNFVLHCDILAENNIQKKNFYNYSFDLFKNYSNTLNSATKLIL